MVDGSERIVEVKDDGWAGSDPRHAVRLAHAAGELERAGAQLVIHTRRDIQAEPRFSAVAQVQRHRRTAVSAATQVHVLERLGMGEAVLGELQRQLGGGVYAFATLCALMVRRTIAIDLDAGLHDGAMVRAIA